MPAPIRLGISRTAAAQETIDIDTFYDELVPRALVDRVAQINSRRANRDLDDRGGGGQAKPKGFGGTGDPGGPGSPNQLKQGGNNDQGVSPPRQAEGIWRPGGPGGQGGSTKFKQGR